MPGAPDPLYIAARRVLLDALSALHDQLDAIVLVGAQAVYVHAGEGDLAVAPFTTDDVSRWVTRRAITELSRMFGSPNAPGSQMAVRAAGPLESGETLSASLTILAHDLIAALSTA